MTHLELFSGIGGFRRAMDLLSHDGIMNFTTIGFSEIDEKATQTYCINYNTRGEIAIGDIVKFTGNPKNIDNLPHIDIITGGFPCQSFSVMGNQDGFADPERGQMFFRIIDIVCLKRPRYLLLENVKNLHTHDKGRTFKNIKRTLEDLGYKVFSNIFNTKDFHLPQRRSRVLIFATLEDIIEDFDKEFTPKKISKFFDGVYQETSVLHFDTTLDLLSKSVDDKYFLSEKIKPTILSDGSGGFKSRSDINQKIARTLTASMHKMHRACQDNYYSQNFIDSHGADDPVQYMTKEELAQLAIRKLTPQEAFLLQGFPSEFATRAQQRKIGDGALYKQAGNAVSVNTIYAVLYYLIQNNKIIDYAV